MVGKGFPKSLNVNFNILALALLIIAIFVNYWLSEKGVSAGSTYWNLIIGVVAVVVLSALIFFKDDDLPELTKIVKAPFGTNLRSACIWFLGGLGTAMAFGVLVSAFGSFSITSLSIPMYGSNIISGLSQSFAQAEIQSSMAWKIVVMVFDAGTIEEFVFSWGMVLACAILVWALVKLYFKDKVPFMERESFILLFAIILSTLAFTGLHVLNGNYVNWYMFLIAGGFKLISLITIYYFGVPLTYWIGYHMANNLMFLIQKNGFATVLNGLLGWVGIVTILFLAGIIWYAITGNGKESASSG